MLIPLIRPMFNPCLIAKPENFYMDLDGLNMDETNYFWRLRLAMLLR